ncbi:MAG: hypothetical protein J6Z02_00110 [Lachnospiraceae bacterium]|nr:hypothetical protein [Lachnospiraceae bacterium]
MSTPKDVEARAVVSMLGQFEIRYNGVVLTDNLNRSHKTWNTLAYVLENKKRAVTQAEFFDVLLSEERITNPTNALKTQFYRIRTLLEPLNIGYGGAIVSQRGAYSWNPHIPCSLDSELFEKLCKKGADASVPMEERLQSYARAVELYKGDYLPKLMEEAWTVPIRIHYHALYVESVKDYCDLLFELNDYESIIKTVSKAIKIETLDEQLYIYLIKAYIADGNQSAALSTYDTATDIMFKNLGLGPSSELHNIYRSIMDSEKSIETDLIVIQQSLSESASKNGAFICEYGFFINSYQLTARRLARLGLTCFLCLLTLSRDSSLSFTSDQLDLSMRKLLETVKFSLRSGDVVARYSSMQYVILLPAASYESAEMVMERIMTNHKQQNRCSPFTLSYKIREIHTDFDEGMEAPSATV